MGTGVFVELKEDIRSRLNIEDVIGEYVQLKRAGRNFKGLSPFSQEKTPSFMVSPEKHIWHDFSSGKGGDVFSFIMEVEGVDFKGAMELLARKAGVDVSQYRGGGDSKLGKKKESLFAINEIAANIYQRLLVQSTDALEYVRKKRGLSKEIIQDFKIGYSPEHPTVLSQLLKKRGYSERDIIDAGLANNRYGELRDMFRGRIMVPLMDPQGRVVGFTARMLGNDPNTPKYINTAQTMLYDKGRHIFGLHMAKEAIRQQDFAVVVEGQLDVISSHQAGVKNVVATAGTALTEYHLRTLSRFTQDVRLAFDADKAGIAATERAIAIASNLGVSLSVITIPEGKDPDELIKEDVGVWQTALAHPQDAVEWLMGIYAKRYDLTTADGKRRATDHLFGIIRPITDAVLLEHYMRRISDRIGSSLEALSKKLNQQPAPTPQHPTKTPKVAHKGVDPYKYQDELLALAWAHPQMRDSFNRLEPAYFAGETRRHIAAHLKEDRPLLQSDTITVKIGELEIIAQVKYPTVHDRLYFEAADIAKRIIKEHKQNERSHLAHLFAKSTEHAERQELNKKIKQLEKEIEALKH